MTTPPSDGNGNRATPREWTGLAVLALPTLLLSIDMTVLYLALPELSADLAPTSTQQLWILDIYAFMIGGFLVTMGTLGDRIGRRKLLLVGAVVFGLASVLAAYSVSAEMLIVTRALLGLAGATLMPSTLALIRNMFEDQQQRAVAIGVWMMCFMSGMALGPLVGGVVLQHFWWGATFLIGVPVMVLLVATAPFLLPEYKAPDAGRLDLLSALMLLAMILPVIYALKEFASEGPGVLSVLALTFGLVVGTLFVLRQRKLADPLLDVNLFKNRTFSTALGSMLFGVMAMSAVMLFVTQYFQLIQGLSPLQAGLWLLPSVAGMMVGFMVAPAMAAKIRPGVVIGGGLGLSVLGFLILTQIEAGSGFALLIVGQVVLGMGISPLLALGTDLVVGSAPEEKAGSAAATSETAGELGGALGVATLGSVGVAVYQNQMADAIPADVPSAAADSASETLVGAMTAAQQFPSDAQALLVPAQEAFTQGMNLAAGVSAVLLIVVAVLTMTLMRHIPPIGGTESDRAIETPKEAAKPSRRGDGDVVPHQS
ncbi:MFS transporter [Prauserella marina]|uniref:MFS transporter, DHA2 family, multidrug resistance protein n=1 Tax=Prauserella marina TaxID=530584 RepID=A0A222VRJ9_9PSEU|nr:MFS transporter [Prauserella marina]ASR36351.1 MFS transporter [Prauserella marina]PWV77141.1 DHA2 family multidrug resistance protein-like MFS transporter [Prauserella marina]SDD05382.1 MFS transporter, DHA2 family, multidrug resistance protein [Prauserella marina]